MRSLLRVSKGLHHRQAAQHAIHTLCRTSPGNSIHASVHLSKGQAAILWQQVRHARKTRTTTLESAPDPDELPEDFELPEVPPEVLAEWEKDPSVQEALDLFASADLKGKRRLSYRDVAKLLESMGCDKETFLNLFQPDDDEGFEGDEITGKGMGGKGGKGGKGGMYESDFDDFGGGGKSKGKGKGGKGGMYEDDFDDFGGGGKSKGKGKGGKRGMYEDDDDDFGGGGKSKGKGKGGKKGGFGGGFDGSFDGDFEEFGGGGRSTKGGGGKGKGKGKKGGY